jgi:hypothetical protein
MLFLRWLATKRSRASAFSRSSCSRVRRVVGHVLALRPLRRPKMLLSGRVRLIDNMTLRAQLASLERHVLAGREVVRRPAVASAHDDIAAAAAGAIAAVKQAASVPEVPIVGPLL